MRNVPGRHISLRGNDIYVEEAGTGDVSVVFESGMGCGRTLWDPVLPLLAGAAHTVAYDRAGRGRSAVPGRPQSLDDMADTLVELVEAVARDRVVLVAHSMGGLIVRRAAEMLSSRLAGMVLVDTTPESAPVYQDYAPAAKKVDRILSVQRAVSRIRPLARMATKPYGRMFPADTYETMLAEDFSPAGVTQTKRELAALVDGLAEYRSEPPKPPGCAVTVISAARAGKYQARNHEVIREHQREYAAAVGGLVEDADSEHMVPAEQPEQVAAAIRQLLAG